MAAFIGLALLIIETAYLYAKLPETVHNQQRTQPETEANTVQIALLDIQRRLSTLIPQASHGHLFVCFFRHGVYFGLFDI